MSTQHPDEPGQTDGSAGMQPAGTEPASTGYEPVDAAPPQGSPGHVLPAYPTEQTPAPTVTPTRSSNRGLWLGLGIGGAVVAALVLVGGVAFGFALRHHDRGDEHVRGPLMSQQGPGQPDGLGTPPGGGYGPDQDGDGPGGMMGRQGPTVPGGPLGALGPLGGGLHGTVVLPDGSGYTTVAMQRGTVSSVSPSSLTVRSTDGYSATYRVSSATRVVGGTPQDLNGSVTDLSQGDDVSVVAKGAKAPLTAQVVARG